ncbi:MAG: hypothetical protein ACJAV1_000222 [Paraglaciecola sp.]|jgi:hypothetical protein
MHSNEARRSIRTKANFSGRCRASMYHHKHILPLRGQRWIRTQHTKVRLTTLPVYPIHIDLVSTDRHLE